MKKVLIMALAMLVVIASCKKKTDDPVTPTTTTTISVDQTHSESGLVNDTVIVLANVTCSSTIGSVKLCYNLEGSTDSTMMDMTAGEFILTSQTYNYSAIFIAPSEPTIITWYVIATATDGTTAKSLKEEIIILAPEETDIVLNEISGVSKFIELYNPNDEEIDISNYYLVKNDEADIIWSAVEGQKIAAKGYLLLYSSKSDVVPEGYPEELIFKGGISPKKSLKVELFNEDAESIDAFTRGPEPWDTSVTEVDKAFARTPNGGDWKLAAETPGTANPDTGDDIPQE